MGGGDSDFFFQAEDGIRDLIRSRGLGDVYKRQLWYWASAGKSLTAFMVGIAQQENYLSISDTTSDYLGQGWTNCTQSQEEKILSLIHI